MNILFINCLFILAYTYTYFYQHITPQNSMEEIPLKKRKIELHNIDDDFSIPSTETIGRKKCAIIENGLAIKYNKLVYNFEKIVNFKHFRKYCVFFDIFSKRHLINHEYRIDFLEILNRYDFTPYAYEECNCNKPVFTTCTGFLMCLKNLCIERKKYSNHRDDKSEHMKKLYEKHSLLYEENNFYDNRINECFVQKIKKFEEIFSLVLLNKKKLKILHKNIYNNSLPYIINCPKCKHMQTTGCSTWRIVRFSNRIDMSNLCDNVLKLDDKFLIPNYNSAVKDDENIKIVLYKSSKCNIVFLYDDIFNVVNSQNVIIIFNIETFKKTRFFCNFNFYFVKHVKLYTDNNYININ